MSDERTAERPARSTNPNVGSRQRGPSSHRFYGADRPILVVDEWPDPESFEAFFQQERSNIEPIMATVGATGEPEMRFGRKLESGDDVGSD